MYRALILLLLFLAAFAWGQDAEDSDTAPSEAAEPAEETDADDPLADIDDLDELYPVEDDDEFIPSEDVAFGQSIPFPTDI